MKPIDCLVVLVLALATPSPSAADETDIANLLVGSWLCDSGACWEEEIAFAIEDGQRTYYSWLHERPATIDGVWSVAGSTVRIQCCDGLDYEFVVVRVTDTELVLRDAVSGEETLMKRFIANDGPVAPTP